MSALEGKADIDQPPPLTSRFMSTRPNTEGYLLAGVHGAHPRGGKPTAPVDLRGQYEGTRLSAALPGAPMGESRRGQGPSRVKVSARRPHAPARLSAPWQFPVLGSVLGLKLTIPERSRTVGAGHTGRKPLALLGNKMVRTAGVEPARGLPLRILSPVCLPVPPRPR